MRKCAPRRFSDPIIKTLAVTGLPTLTFIVSGIKIRAGGSTPLLACSSASKGLVKLSVGNSTQPMKRMKSGLIYLEIKFNAVTHFYALDLWIIS
jgi:hypothetical protein